MRGLHAKAPSAGSAEPLAPRPSRKGRGLFGMACLCVLGFTAFLGTGAPSAGAANGDPCPNAAIRAQQGSQHLPDCRAYELVSVEHQGFATGAGPVPVVPNTGVWFLPGGDRIAFPSIDPFVGDSGNPGTFLSSRGPNGWSSAGLFPSSITANIVFPAVTAAVSDDGTKLVIDTFAGLLPSDTDFANDVYLVNPDKSLTLVSDGASDSAYYAGRSDDATHIVFQTVANLTPEASGSSLKLYEWVNGTISLVGVKPDGSVDPDGSVIGRREDGVGTVSRPFNAVSPDAAAIFFTSPTPSAATAGNPTRVYVRKNGTTTVEASASQCTRLDCNAPSDVVYADATRTGSHVFFTTTQQLTNDDTDTTNDLYAFEVATGALTRLSAGVGATVPQVFRSLVLASADDGQRVYFLNGVENIEVYDHGTLTELGASGGDVGGSIENCLQTGSGLGVPEATPEGGVFVFSTTSFTPTGPGPSGAGIFRYDVTSGELTKIASSGTLPGDIFAYPECDQRRGLSDDGSTVVFTTAAPLDAHDVNGVEDVYEWRGGMLSLVSQGTGSQESRLLGISPDAGDVYLTSGDRLVPQDQDDVQDVYDARIGGGFAFEPPPPPCDGEGCRGAPSAQPNASAPTSSAFVGAGNANARAKARRCAKGKRRIRVRGKTRCVRRKTKRSNRANADRRARR